mgnify:CR=1 FL=1
MSQPVSGTSCVHLFDTQSRPTRSSSVTGRGSMILWPNLSQFWMMVWEVSIPSRKRGFCFVIFSVMFVLPLPPVTMQGRTKFEVPIRMRLGRSTAHLASPFVWIFKFGTPCIVTVRHWLSPQIVFTSLVYEWFTMIGDPWGRYQQRCLLLTDLIFDQ